MKPQQPTLFEQPAAWKATETRDQAHRRVREEEEQAGRASGHGLGGRQAEVYNYLRATKNATNMEVAAALGWTINRVTPRCLELRQKGLVEPGPKRICLITRRIVQAWRVVSGQARNGS